LPVVVCGCGYIGSRLTVELLDAGEEVVVLDNLFSTDERAVRNLSRNSRVSLIIGDVSDSSALDHAFTVRGKPDVVFHLAAQASAQVAVASPDYTEITNLRGPRCVLDACLRHGVPRFVFASSMRVYGPSLKETIDEQSPFGEFGDLSHLSHLYAEKLAEMYANTYGIACQVVRIGLVYGIAPVMKTDLRFMTAPNKFCLQTCRGDVPQITAGGESYHGLIHVVDAARAMTHAARVPLSQHFTPFNAVTDVRTIREVASLVAAEAGKNGRRIPIDESRPSRLETMRPTVRSRLVEVGFAPICELVTGLREVLSFFSPAALECDS
jgi:UDP-glucose 4-epimerase